MKTKIIVLSLLSLWVLSSTVDWYYEYGECKPYREGYKVVPASPTSNMVKNNEQ